LLTQGGDFISNGRAVLNSDAAKAAADIYLNKLLKENGPQGTANMSWLEASAVFKEATPRSGPTQAACWPSPWTRTAAR
jgi:hypothetical protein